MIKAGNEREKLEMRVGKLEEIQLITAWGMKRAKGDQVQLHEHNYYELVYYAAGSGETSLGSEVLNFSSGTYALIPPCIRHDEQHWTNGEVYCIGFCTNRHILPALRNDTYNEVFSLVKAILTEAAQQQSGYREMIRAKLLELTVIMRRAEEDRNIPVPKNFEYVINYLSDYYYEKIILTELANHLNLSYDYFQHRFRQLMGISPQQFLLKKRLEAATAMLIDSRATCTEIAYRCGFSNSSQFAMLFKRENGVTPYQYRQIRNQTGR